MRRNLLHRKASFGILAVLVSAVVGCSSDGDTVETTVPTTVASTTSAPPDTAEVPTSPMFGDMASPCGPATNAGAPVVAEGQNGSSPLKLGVAGDHGYFGADDSQPATSPGVEMLDAARAFASWCNEQGGLRGLPIDIVDLDASLTNVPLAMEQACADVFALVGGGWALDEQMYPRFHECGMVSFPAFTVSAAASLANGKVQAVPAPIDREATNWLRWIEETYSDAADDIAIVHADLPATRVIAERLAATMQIVGGFGDPLLLAHEPSGTANWSDIVDQMQSANIRAVSFIGDPTHLVALQGAMGSAGFAPDVVFGESNLVSDVLVTATPFDNLRIRSIHAPFTERDSAPGIGAYLEMMRVHGSSGGAPSRTGSLGLFSTSALLLFVSAADTCLDLDANVLERECILAEAKKITAWTAGAAHAPTNPSSQSPTSCMVVLGIESGAWTRVFPVLGSDDDDSDGDGFSCDDESIVAVDGNFGDATAGIDSSRQN